MVLFIFFWKKNYKINLDKSVSLTKLSKFLLIYSLLIIIFSPARSVAVKLISSTDRSGEKIIINKEYINKNLDNLVKDTDLSKFIL